MEFFPVFRIFLIGHISRILNLYCNFAVLLFTENVASEG